MKDWFGLERVLWREENREKKVSTKEEPRQTKGKLWLFFGFADGVSSCVSISV
jgi:hypothetical protein